MTSLMFQSYALMATCFVSCLIFWQPKCLLGCAVSAQHSNMYFGEHHRKAASSGVDLQASSSFEEPSISQQLHCPRAPSSNLHSVETKCQEHGQHLMIYQKRLQNSTIMCALDKLLPASPLGLPSVSQKPSMSSSWLLWNCLWILLALQSWRTHRRSGSKNSSSSNLVMIVLLVGLLVPEANCQLVFSCGLNINGQLAIGDVGTTRSTPVYVTNALSTTSITAVTTGNYNTLMLSSSGRIYGAGDNDAGELGLGITGNARFTPTKMDFALSTLVVSAVDMGASHALILIADGTVYGSGSSSVGQLGLGDTTNRNTPVKIDAGGLSSISITKISAGGYHSLFLTASGRVLAAGSDEYGQLGIGTATIGAGSGGLRTTATLVDNNALSTANVVAISTGGQHSLFLTSTGFVYSCGGDDSGQLGLGSSIAAARSTPTLVGSNTVFSTISISVIAAGYQHSLLGAADMKVYSMGLNNAGQLGLGDFSVNRNTPSRVGYGVSTVSISTVAAGYYHSLLLSTGGVVFGMGNNDFGQIGNFGTTVRVTPTSFILALSTASATGIAAGFYHTVILAIPRPTISSVVRRNTPPTSSLSVTILGSSFPVVTAGGSPYTQRAKHGQTNSEAATWISSSCLTAKTPRGWGSQLPVAISAATGMGTTTTLTTYDIASNPTSTTPNNGPKTGAISITMLAWNFATFDLSVRNRAGTTSSTNSAWSSATSVRVKTPLGQDSFLGTANTVMKLNGGTLTKALTFGGVALPISSNLRANSPMTAGVSITLFVASGSTVDSSLYMRIGATSTSSTAWFATNSIKGKTCQGQGGIAHKTMATLLQNAGTLSNAITYQVLLVSSTTTNNSPNSGALSVTLFATDLSLVNLSPRGRTGMTSAESSLWISTTTVRSKMCSGIDVSARLSSTLRTKFGTLTAAITYQGVDLTVTRLVATNLPITGSLYLEIVVANAGSTPSFTPKFRIGGTSTERGTWGSNTGIRAKCSRGYFGNAGVSSGNNALSLSLPTSGKTSMTKSISYESFGDFSATQQFFFSGRRNSPLTAATSVTLLASKWAVFTSASVRMGLSSSEAGSWISSTNIKVKSNSIMNGMQLPIIATILRSALSTSKAASYDGFALASVNTGAFNMPCTGAVSVSVFGSNIGMSPSCRLEYFTVAPGTSWSSTTSFVLKACAGVRSNRSLFSVSAGKGFNSQSNFFSYDIEVPAMSVFPSNIPSSGARSVTLAILSSDPTFGRSNSMVVGRTTATGTQWISSSSVKAKAGRGTDISAVPVVVSLSGRKSVATLTQAFSYGPWIKSSVALNFTAVLQPNEAFGQSISMGGDINGDAFSDVAVGSSRCNDGGTQRGCVYVMFMSYGSSVSVQSHNKISSTFGGFTAALKDNDAFGASCSLGGDISGDGIPELAVGANRDDDGTVDGGAVYVISLSATGTIKSHKKLSATSGTVTPALASGDYFGSSVSIGPDLNNDGVLDLAIGASGDDSGGTDRGAVYIAFMNSDCTAKSYFKMSSTATSVLNQRINDFDAFGSSVSLGQDVNGDGLWDLAVGAAGSSQQSQYKGSAYVLMMGSQGASVKSCSKIGDAAGGFTAIMNAQDSFGSSVTLSKDANQDGIPDMAVGSPGDDTAGVNRGALYFLFLASDGSVKSSAKISSGLSNVASSDDGAAFGASVWMNGRDFDGDGSADILSGSPSGGNYTGSVSAMMTQFLDINECELGGNRGCSLNATCVNTYGSFSCACNTGYTGSGMTCTDINECSTTCFSTGSNCTNIPGSYYCSCRVGYTGSGFSCSDINECQTTTHGCPNNATCTNTFGSYTCNTPDVNECLLGTHNCNSHAICLNTVGSFLCSCNAGFSGDGVSSCVGVQCNTPGFTNCDVHATCANTVDSFSCTCNVGYSGSGITCTAIPWVNNGTTIPVAEAEPNGGFAASFATGYDVNQDGLSDLIVGAPYEGNTTGSVYVIFLQSSSATTQQQDTKHSKITSGIGGIGQGIVKKGDYFGAAVGVGNDVNGDTIPDVLVGSGSGYVLLLMMNRDGSVKNFTTYTAASVASSNAAAPSFGQSLTFGPDVNGDSVPDIAIAAPDEGLVWIIFLSLGGNITSFFKISSKTAVTGRSHVFDSRFLSMVTTRGTISSVPPQIGGSISFGYDIDGDGNPDLVSGAPTMYNNTGSVFVMFMGPNSTSIKSIVEITNATATETQGQVINLRIGDAFGTSVSLTADLSGDGIPDLLVGSPGDDQGGTDRGAAYVMFLERNAVVKSYSKFSSTSSGVNSAVQLPDSKQFGLCVGIITSAGSTTPSLIVSGVDPFNYTGSLYQLQVQGLKPPVQQSAAILPTVAPQQIGTDTTGSSQQPFRYLSPTTVRDATQTASNVAGIAGLVTQFAGGGTGGAPSMLKQAQFTALLDGDSSSTNTGSFIMGDIPQITPAVSTPSCRLFSRLFVLMLAFVALFVFRTIFYRVSLFRASRKGQVYTGVEYVFPRWELSFFLGASWGIFEAAGITATGVCPSEPRWTGYFFFIVLLVLLFAFAVWLFRTVHVMNAALWTSNVELLAKSKLDPVQIGFVKRLVKSIQYRRYLGEWSESEERTARIFSGLVEPVIGNARKIGVTIPIIADVFLRNLIAWLSSYYESSGYWFLGFLAAFDFIVSVLVRPSRDRISMIMEPFSAFSRLVSVFAIVTARYSVISTPSAGKILDTSNITGLLFLVPPLVTDLVPAILMILAAVWELLQGLICPRSEEVEGEGGQVLESRMEFGLQAPATTIDTELVQSPLKSMSMSSPIGSISPSSLPFISQPLRPQPLASFVTPRGHSLYSSGGAAAAIQQRMEHAFEIKDVPKLGLGSYIPKPRQQALSPMTATTMAAPTMATTMTAAPRPPTLSNFVSRTSPNRNDPNVAWIEY